MSLNSTQNAERLHIGFFGVRNAGKSSLVNAVTGQDLAVVSDYAGTTTDPVKKAMELLPLGPVVIIDTAGIDDEGELGEMRVKKTKNALNLTDVAVLVCDATKGLTTYDDELISIFENKRIPYVIAYNKSDLKRSVDNRPNTINVSAATGENIYELKELIASLLKTEEDKKTILGDLVEKGDRVVLVTPIDASAPKGRLILPQVQTLRELLDIGAVTTVVQIDELSSALEQHPKLVITDSQAFGKVSRLVPKTIMLTSFSILFARYKGDLEETVKGVTKLKSLNDGDTVLISEGCTHHRQCGDIGTVKLPKWIEDFTGKRLNFRFTSGTEFPETLDGISLVVHCGACMLNKREMQYRTRHTVDSGVPITNYGITIAYTHGILERSLEVFPNIKKYLEDQR
ncbi:MAG: [FeFe] hydrogenase H-cluster maturation GTPase HydF [Clostridia bacterium]|nr:[FeFe] hydrogenase H-cluster maturation GTPase HydF [Clostridia bacterium]